MNLIVGATGLLGGEICRRLTAEGEAITALVRDTSDPEKVAQLTSLGVELVRGDLKNLPSLKAACRDVRTVISTASSTLSRQSGDSIDTVDRQGQLDLIDAAEAAGVQRFVLISFPSVEIDFPLQHAKRAVEDRLRRSRMAHTILQPTCFMEVWLSPALGFDVANGQVQIYGDGRNRTSWISFQDVGRFAVSALDNPHATNATVKLGGPDALSPLEVVRLAEQSVGKPVVVRHVPEEALRAQLSAAADPLQQSFAGLMLYYARGDVVDMTETSRAMQVDQLKSVSDYFGGTTTTT
jgi:NADH dehydrogenase